jgi:branched-chain amino acid transport system permease protein
MGTLIGPIIGAVLIFAFKTVFWAYLSDFQLLYLIILGAVIALSVVFLPNGLWGTILQHKVGRGGDKKAPTLKRKCPVAPGTPASGQKRLSDNLKSCVQKEGGE